MSEATVWVAINDKDSHEFFISDYEMNEAPETTAYDISKAVVQDLNTRSWDAVVKIKIQGTNASSPRLTFEYVNGGRGWEARSTFESWLLQSLSMITEHDAKYGPISSDKNRRDASSYMSKHGVAR